ncbi:hypothetical protein QJQ45_022399 [Haematococcus lacustris]|nr:hypothetical protein QJQ45_022399 [Haematococcus lacustris]
MAGFPLLGVAALGILLAAVVAVAFVFLKLASGSAQQTPGLREGKAAQHAEDAEEEEEEAEEGRRRPGAAARRGAADRMRGGRLRQRAVARAAQQEAQARQQQEVSVSEGSSEESEGGEGEDQEQRNKKQRNRQARREAREAERLAREAREAKAAGSTLYDERRRKRDAEREALEKAQEEEMARAAAEAARREEAEAAKWMGMIKVEEEGVGVTEDSDAGQGLLNDFLEYIKQRKTVPLEQLATHFKMRTTDAIDRIHGLEASGRLTGVMDERGKYIYVSLEEMKAVADFMTQRGRVAIHDLAVKSSKLIDLEPRTAVTSAVPGTTIDFESLT